MLSQENNTWAIYTFFLNSKLCVFGSVVFRVLVFLIDFLNRFAISARLLWLRKIWKVIVEM